MKNGDKIRFGTSCQVCRFYLKIESKKTVKRGPVSMPSSPPPKRQRVMMELPQIDYTAVHPSKLCTVKLDRPHVTCLAGELRPRLPVSHTVSKVEAVGPCSIVYRTENNELYSIGALPYEIPEFPQSQSPRKLVIPNKMKDNFEVLSVSLGHSHMLLAVSNKEKDLSNIVLAQGDNTYGQCGFGTEWLEELQAVSSLTGMAIKKVRTGLYISGVLTSSGDFLITGAPTFNWSRKRGSFTPISRNERVRIKDAKFTNNSIGVLYDDGSLSCVCLERRATEEWGGVVVLKDVEEIATSTDAVVARTTKGRIRVFKTCRKTIIPPVEFELSTESLGKVITFGAGGRWIGVINEGGYWLSTDGSKFTKIMYVEKGKPDFSAGFGNRIMIF